MHKLFTDLLPHVASSLKPVEFATLVTSYLRYLDQADKRQEYWHKLLALLRDIEMDHRGLEVLQAILEAGESGLLSGLTVDKEGSNSSMMTLMTHFQQGGDPLLPKVIEGLLHQHGMFRFRI